jgi:uncharacterized membrane protein
MPDHSGTTPAERVRATVLLLLAALACGAVLAVWLESGNALSRILLGTFLLAPLALPVAGLVRRNRRAYAWATLCLTPHFVYGLTEMVANPTVRPVAALMLVLSLALMGALVAYLRLTRPRKSV